MPIILAPAHELDTLNTVVLRCRHVAKKLEQHHVVLTVDEALFCKLMDLKWAKPQYQDFLVVRLGGPHTALKFMEVNLLDLWKHGSRAICLAPKQLKRLGWEVLCTWNESSQDNHSSHMETALASAADLYRN